VVLVVISAAGCGRANALGDLKYFPGAGVVGTTSFAGERYGFPDATWDQVELRSSAPYPQVHDFYAKTAIPGWTSTFESENRKSNGRVYSRYLADDRRRRFYAITVEEREASHDVSVLLRRGTAR
jgi:hypothetical protein